jgi:hypothetical protein
MTPHATSNPTAPHKAAVAKWKATTKRVQPLTKEQIEARMKAKQRHVDGAGKAEKVAKAKAAKASAERLHANRTK